MWKKFARIPLSLPKRGSGVSPIQPGEKFFEGPITFRTHIGAHILFTFITYIQNYIQKLHFNIHQNYIHSASTLLPTFTHIRLPFGLPRSPTCPPARSLIHLLHHTKSHPFYLHLEITFQSALELHSFHICTLACIHTHRRFITL